MMRNKLIIEFIGTFFLVLTVALTGNPIAIGAVLSALVYMGGYISGAHFNPAVTLALLIAKKVDLETALRYVPVQFAGSIAASMIYFVLRGGLFLPQAGLGVSLAPGIIVELLFTFLLASVVLHVAATNKTKGNQYFGLAIGFTLMVAVFAGGSISGGAFNPAVGLGPLLLDLANFNTHASSFITYLVGPLTGGVLAGLIYKN